MYILKYAYTCTTLQIEAIDIAGMDMVCIKNADIAVGWFFPLSHQVIMMMLAMNRKSNRLFI